ncbi:MAG: DUF896 domain-containing protein [Ruminococcaceae bacterium]|nr:DUF896 domain-containing protein [Oscillospiraceae bacterium]
MEKAKIDRINALAAKSKTAKGLTPEEAAEQKALREEYLTEYRRALRGGGNDTVVLNADGTKKVVKK